MTDAAMDAGDDVPVVVEPREAGAVSVRARAVATPSGEVVVEARVQNDGDEAARVQCVAGQVRRARLRALRRFRARDVREGCAPGAEHVLTLQAPPGCNRLWLTLRPAHSRRSFVFALTVEADAAPAPGRPPLGRLLVHLVAPFTVPAVLVAATGSPVGGAVIVTLGPPAFLLHEDLCVRRLERKLSRLRAALA